MIAEIARREFTVRARTKSWRVVTGLLVVLTVGLVVAAAVIDGGSDDGRREVTVAIGAGADPGLGALLDDPTRSRFDVTLVESSGDPEADLDDGEVDVVVDGDTLVWRDSADPELSLVLQQAIGALAAVERGRALGIGSNDVASLLTPATVGERVLDDDESDGVGAGAGVVAMILTFVGIQAYGSLMTLGVVEEKSSRVVEVLLSQVRARDLLAGKLIGIGAMAVLQLVVVLVGAVVALVVTDTVDVSRPVVAAIPLVVVTFSAGFVLYAVLFALAGSLVSRQEDAQQVMLPVMAPLFVGYILGFEAAASPDSLASRIGSLVPFTSPFVLPVRVAAGSAGAGEVAVALVLLVAAMAGAWILAGRIYELTLLRMGSRIPIRDAFGLLRRNP